MEEKTMGANNLVMVIGHAGKDPEMKYLDTGTALTKFSVAVKRPVKDKSGIDTDWFDCVFFGKQAERAGSLIKKGTLVSVVGTGRIEQWGEGENRKSKFSIHGDTFYLLSPKGKQDDAVPAETKGEAADGPPPLDVEDEDLPPDDETPF